MGGIYSKLDNLVTSAYSINFILQSQIKQMNKIYSNFNNNGLILNIENKQYFHANGLNSQNSLELGGNQNIVAENIPSYYSLYSIYKNLSQNVDIPKNTLIKSIKIRHICNNNIVGQNKNSRDSFLGLYKLPMDETTGRVDNSDASKIIKLQYKSFTENKYIPPGLDHIYVDTEEYIFNNPEYFSDIFMVYQRIKTYDTNGNETGTNIIKVDQLMTEIQLTF